MEEKTNKLTSDWVRCQSKSRSNKFYLFNTKTGETNWCSENDNVNVKTISAKNAFKTPAQDRMKRLQNQLEKKRIKEAAAERDKTGRHAKTDEKKDHPHSTKNYTITTRADGPVIKELQKTPSSKVKKSLVHESSTSSKKAKALSKNVKDVATSSKCSSVQKRLIIPPRESPEKSVRKKSAPAESIKTQPVDIVHGRNKSKSSWPVNPIPRANITQSNNSPNQLVQKPKQKSVSPAFCADASQRSEVKLSLPTDDDIEIDYDENKNERQSEEKPGFLSKIKNFCNNLLNGTATSSKQSQSSKKVKDKLSLASKPAFKSKKSGNKNLLKGVSYAIDIKSAQKPSLLANCSPQTSPVAAPIIHVPNESANDRLSRLRKSLQQQQALHAHVPVPTVSPSSSNECVSSPLVSDCEPMDWQPIADSCTEIVKSPSASSGISSDLSTRSEYTDIVSKNIMRMAASKSQRTDWRRDQFYVVVDTNVFIQNPAFVEELTTMKLCDTAGTVIYIPYCVLQELDKLKMRSSSESTRIRTVRAIKLLNKAFEENHPQYQAQSAADERIHLIQITSPDDSILNCCLQIKQHIENLLLLTEDVNLQSKAMCNDILVSTKSDLISLH